MKILITGTAGFIGFHLASLLSKKHYCTGIDSFNNYYDLNLKKDRVNILKKHGVTTHKIDLSNYQITSNFFKKNKFDIIVHLAAQAGVRYSISNPQSYIQNNIIATHNILSLIKDNPPKHLLIASTSSVYGHTSGKSLNEKKTTDSPISLYAATKKSIESISHSYSYTYKIPVTVMRFFTVYGPWGRPDMALFKFVDAIMNNKSIEVYNGGKMWRDFTYVDDLTKSIQKLLNVIPSKKKFTPIDSISNVAPFRIVNIGNQKSVNLNKYIETLEKIIGKKSIRTNLPMQTGDVPFTLSDSGLLNNLIKFKPNTPVEFGIKKFFDWYLDYYKIKK